MTLGRIAALLGTLVVSLERRGLSIPSRFGLYASGWSRSAGLEIGRCRPKHECVLDLEPQTPQLFRSEEGLPLQNPADTLGQRVRRRIAATVAGRCEPRAALQYLAGRTVQCSRAARRRDAAIGHPAVGPHS